MFLFGFSRCVLTNNNDDKLSFHRNLALKNDTLVYYFFQICPKRLE